MKDKVVSDRVYNFILYGCLLYGCLMNFIMVKFSLNILDLVPNIIVFYIIYFALALTGIFMSKLSDNPIISFIGYNLVVVPIGFIVDISVRTYGGLESNIVQQAFLITLVVFGLMTAVSVIAPNFCRRLGGILFISLLGLIITEIIFLILHIDSILFAWIGAGIFTLYIAYDTRKAHDIDQTIDNAVDSAVGIYLDIINLFLDLLSILGNSKSNRK